MSVSKISKFRRKIKFGINIPLKVFKKPKHRNSVTSDLFPIRNDKNWTTEFEFLNLPGLIRGDISSKHKAKLVFFRIDEVDKLELLLVFIRLEEILGS